MTAATSSVQVRNGIVKRQLYDSISRLTDWLERHDYQAYDPFDGLNAKFLRRLTFEKKFLRTALQQGVRRFPINLRPFLGIAKGHSTKGMGFVAKGFIRLHEASGDPVWRERAEGALEYLMDHQTPGFAGACWGNHFDYQSRTFYLPQGMPTVVWTSLIGHAFLDGYDRFTNDVFLQVAISSCEHILHDLGTVPDGDGACISYIPGMNNQVHNANMLGASLLARTYLHTGNEAYRALAEKAVRYTAQYQRSDGSWYYGEAADLHWVDNFHTAYVLDCFKHYACGAGDSGFESYMKRGYEYWKNRFFLADGAPRYYSHKTLPIDIQCCSQAIDTLVFFQEYDPGAIPLAMKVALWTIEKMQDRTGYFYYRRYPWVVNRTPTLHWGQGTMLSALAGLYKLM